MGGMDGRTDERTYERGSMSQERSVSWLRRLGGYAWQGGVHVDGDERQTKKDVNSLSLYHSLSQIVGWARLSAYKVRMYGAENHD